MANNILPLKIKIAAGMGLIISLIFFFLFISAAIIFIQTLFSGCSYMPCLETGIPSQTCPVNCDYFPKSLASNLILGISMFFGGGLFGLFSIKLFQAKKIGLFGIISMLIIVGAFILMLWLRRDFGSLSELIIYPLSLIVSIPLALLLLGAKEFLKIASQKIK